MVTEEAPSLDIRPDDIALVPLDDVRPWPGNPRRGNIGAIRRSLRRFGQQRPILVQRETGQIVAGNHLWHAMVAETEEALSLTAGGLRPGDEKWPKGLREWERVLRALTDLSDVEARAFVVTDNRMSELGENDPDALARWIATLVEDGAIDEALGYASEDIDKMLKSIAKAQTDDDDAPDLPLPRDVWVKPGQMFAIGKHRLIVGDSTSPDVIDRLMTGKDAGMVWTDPPYGVDYVGGTNEHLTIANDAPDEVALRTLLDAALGNAVRVLRPGAALYCAAPGGDRSTVFVAALKAIGVYRQTIIWVKDALVLGRQDFHWRHEPVHLGVKEPDKPAGRTGKPVAKASSNLHYGWRPGAAHYFVTDRTLDTVWEIPRPRASREHPTMKPVELVERSILASSKRGDIVLDPFGGSGTTMVAAERTGRASYMVEMDPMYAQVILQRMERLFGIKHHEYDD